MLTFLMVEHALSIPPIAGMKEWAAWMQTSESRHRTQGSVIFEGTPFLVVSKDKRKTTILGSSPQKGHTHREGCHGFNKEQTCTSDAHTLPNGSNEACTIDPMPKEADDPKNKLETKTTPPTLLVEHIEASCKPVHFLPKSLVPDSLSQLVHLQMCRRSPAQDQ